MKAWLDLARLLFALVVVVDHAVILFLLPDDVFGARLWFPWLNAAAAVAVSGFFLISGFAIAHSVTPVNDPFSLRRFLANRAGRIYPPLLLACALGLALVASRRILTPRYSTRQTARGAPSSSPR